MKSEPYITVVLPTYQRYEGTLPLSLMSLFSQTHKPNRIILVDDSPEKKFYGYPVLRNIVSLLKGEGILFDYFHGPGKGMVPAIQMGLDDIEGGWVLKMDDDHILSPDVLEIFVSSIQEGVGCIGGILSGKGELPFLNPPSFDEKGIYNKIENIHLEPGIQMIEDQTREKKEVEHMYSNFFFDFKSSDRYPEELQPSGNREDTIFTHNIYRKGYKMLVDPSAKIYHLHTSLADYKFSKIKNEIFFLEKMREWGIVPSKFDYRISGEEIIILRWEGEYRISF